jgi:hypothetical protein
MNQTVSDYRFKFSVVTAVYNVEPYLAEAIESILAQDIGFEESVEMVRMTEQSISLRNMQYLIHVFNM